MSDSKSPVSAEGFAWISNLSTRVRDNLVREMAEAKEYAALIAFAASGATHSREDASRPLFIKELAATAFKSLDQHGDEAHPAMRSWLDALIKHTDPEDHLDQAASFIGACANRLRSTTWEMMLTHLSAAIPGLLGTPTEALAVQGRKRSVFAIAIAAMNDSDSLPAIFGDRFKRVPAATEEMNVVEFALNADKPRIAELLLDRCTDQQAVKEAMGRRATSILLSEDKLPLYSNFGDNITGQAAITAFNLISGGAKIEHEDWQKLFAVRLRPEMTNKSVHSLPWVVPRYLEPYQAARVLKAMIEDGGLDPNHTIVSRSTLLHGAVKKNSIPAAEVLLSAGADPTRLDREKRTPAKVAEENNATAIAQLMHAAEMRWKILEVAGRAKSAGVAP